MLCSPSHLKKITAQFKINPGLDPNVMYILKDQLAHSPQTVSGHLMMDDMKLKNGIIWNCKNNEVTKFVEGDLKTKNY